MFLGKVVICGLAMFRYLTEHGINQQKANNMLIRNTEGVWGKKGRNQMKECWFSAIE